MLNLSEIRKKAKKREGKTSAANAFDRQDEPTIEGSVHSRPVVEPVPLKPDAAEGIPLETASPVSEDAPEMPVEHPVRVTIPIEEVPSSSLKDTDEESGFRDPLEELFRVGDELDLATEEAYFEGLVGDAQRQEEDLCQLLSFSLGDEEYAVDIHSVQEIIKLREITDIPRVPSFVQGIISLRGNIIPVFDLKSRLQLGTVAPSATTRIVVCRDGQRVVGLMVDKINQVVRMPLQAVERVSGILSGVNKDLVEGVGRYQGRMLILLDLSTVLTVDQS